MRYFGISENDVIAYESSIKVPEFDLIKKRIDGSIEYYADTLGYSFLVAVTLDGVSVSQNDLTELAQEKYIQLKLDEHFLPLSKELQKPVTMAEFKNALKLQADEMIDKYTLTLIQSDLLK